MAERKKSHTFAHGGRTFMFTRPGRGGLRRLAQRMADSTSLMNGAPSLALLNVDGKGLQMEAVLSEYLTDAPDEWWTKGPDGKTPIKHEGRRVPDFENIDAEEFLAVGEEAVRFHETFRDVDARFSAGGGRAT